MQIAANCSHHGSPGLTKKSINVKNCIVGNTETYPRALNDLIMVIESCYSADIILA